MLNYIHKIFFLFFVINFFSFSNADDKVAYIDMDRILSQSNASKSLFNQLKDIENSSGRNRNSPKFSSRTLDIDIVLQLSDDEEILFESDEIAKYRFVSEPLEEIL